MHAENKALILYVYVLVSRNKHETTWENISLFIVNLYNRIVYTGVVRFSILRWGEGQTVVLTGLLVEGAVRGHKPFSKILFF